jgi:hypothetical protein
MRRALFAAANIVGSIVLALQCLDAKAGAHLRLARRYRLTGMGVAAGSAAVVMTTAGCHFRGYLAISELAEKCQKPA